MPREPARWRTGSLEWAGADYEMARWTRRFPKTWQDYPNVAGFMRAMEADSGAAQVLEQSSR